MSLDMITFYNDFETIDQKTHWAIRGPMTYAERSKKYSWLLGRQRHP